MIYEAMIAVDLPEVLGPGRVTPLAEGLERMLFSGRFLRRDARVSCSAGWVLARCHRALRGQGFAVRALSDAEEVEVAVAPARWGEQPVWAEVLPAAWTTEPADFVLEAARRRVGLAAALRIRHAVRRPLGQPAVVASLRLAVAPDGEDPERLDATADRLAPAWLRRVLDAHGERASAALCDALAAELEGRAAWHGRAKVLVGPLDEHRERTRGLPASALALLERIDVSAGRWPAADGRGVEGRLDGGRFVPLTEVRDAI